MRIIAIALVVAAAIVFLDLRGVAQEVDGIQRQRGPNVVNG